MYEVKKNFKIVKALVHWKSLKISQQVFCTFVLAGLGVISLFIINYINTVLLSSSHTQILKDQNRLQYLMKYNYEIKNIETHSTYIRSNLEAGHTLSLWEVTMVESFPQLLESASVGATALIQEIVPDEYEQFNMDLNAALTVSRDGASASDLKTISKTYFAVLKLVDTNQKVTSIIQKQIEDRIKANHNLNTISFWLTLVLNLTILAVLGFILVPMLREMKTVFAPLRQASKTSLEGATEALNATLGINQAISQLQLVLYNIGNSINDVSLGAQHSATQLDVINLSVAQASELVGELAKQASNILNSLTFHQHNLEEKVNQVIAYTENISTSLDMITQNADSAEKLSIQVANLEEEVTGINLLLMQMNKITEQVNLLALNASIEAARADKRGQGFAVIAERIQKLSDETYKFTNEIKESVIGIERESKDVSFSLNEVISSVRCSISDVQVINTEMASLIELLQTIYHANSEIINATNLQMVDTQKIHTKTLGIMEAVANISSQTEQVSASMQELNASSFGMKTQISQISNKVNETQTVVERQANLSRLAMETANRF